MDDASNLCPNVAWCGFTKTNTLIWAHVVARYGFTKTKKFNLNWNSLHNLRKFKLYHHSTEDMNHTIGRSTRRYSSLYIARYRKISSIHKIVCWIWQMVNDCVVESCSNVLSFPSSIMLTYWAILALEHLPKFFVFLHFCKISFIFDISHFHSFLILKFNLFVPSPRPYYFNFSCIKFLSSF